MPKRRRSALCRGIRQFGRGEGFGQGQPGFDQGDRLSVGGARAADLQHAGQLSRKSRHALHQSVMLAARGDDAAAASAAQDQTLRGQRQKCLTHDRAGDAELLLQLRLCGQRGACGQAAIRDAGPQHRAELAVQRGVPTVVDRVILASSSSRLGGHGLTYLSGGHSGHPSGAIPEFVSQWSMWGVRGLASEHAGQQPDDGVLLFGLAHRRHQRHRRERVRSDEIVP